MKTIEKFMSDLATEGKTVIEWAEEHDFPTWAVYRVTSGGTKGRRGRYHRIMVAMGVKPAGANRQAS